MFHFSAHLLGVIFIIFVGMVVTPRYLNNLPPEQIDGYPNNVILYFQEIVHSPVSLTIVLYFALRKNETLRKEVWQRLESLGLVRMTKSFGNLASHKGDEKLSGP
jgi:hypothetical protein